MNTTADRTKQRLLPLGALIAIFVLMATLAGCACSSNSANDYASEDDAGYIGTWTGKLESTTTGPACYGAQSNPIEVTVKSVETTGRMVVDVKVLYHGHRQSDLASDADSAQGDQLVTLADETTTLENDSFSIVSEQGDDGKLEIKGTWTGVGDSQTLEVKVRSQIGVNPSIEDTFTLAKQ